MGRNTDIKNKVASTLDKETIAPLSSRVEEIHGQLMKTKREGVKAATNTKGETDFSNLYNHTAHLAAMAIAVTESLCGELSGTDPSEWIKEQKSREGDAREKTDPRLKEFATFLQLSGQLLDKCEKLVWRV